VRPTMLAKLHAAAAAKRQQRTEAAATTIQRAWRRHSRAATGTSRASDSPERVVATEPRGAPPPAVELREPPPLPPRAHRRRRSPFESPATIPLLLQPSTLRRVATPRQRGLAALVGCIARQRGQTRATNTSSLPDESPLRLSPIHSDDTLTARPPPAPLPHRERLVPPPPLPRRAACLKSQTQCCNPPGKHSLCDSSDCRSTHLPKRPVLRTSCTDDAEFVRRYHVANDIYKLL
jgi:hypothetical protein